METRMGQGSPKIKFGGLTYCRCPVCGHEENYGHKVICSRIICSKCGSYMIAD